MYVLSLDCRLKSLKYMPSIKVQGPCLHQFSHAFNNLLTEAYLQESFKLTGCYIFNLEDSLDWESLT